MTKMEELRELAQELKKKSFTGEGGVKALEDKIRQLVLEIVEEMALIISDLDL